MNKAQNTQERLLVAAQAEFWSRGYSNVGLREVARAAGADVALIARYFGGKQGLFEATLAFDFDDFAGQDCGPSEIVDRVVQMFVETPRDTDSPSLVQMLVMNAGDAEIGEVVRQFHKTAFLDCMAERFDSQEKAALFVAVILGFSITEKMLHAEGIAPVGTERYEVQLRQMLNAAVGLPDP